MIRWFSLRTTGWTHYGFQQLKTPNKTREQFASFKDTHVPPFKAISAYPTLSDTAHFKFKKHCLPFEEFKEIFMKDILYQNGTWDIKNEICSNYDPHIARESREIGGTCAWTLLQYEDYSPRFSDGIFTGSAKKKCGKWKFYDVFLIESNISI